MATQRLSAKERRQQILRSAIRVFARHSYHGATTKMISEEAGIAEALIYRYFGSKRALFTEAVEHTSSRLVDELETVISEHTDSPLAALRRLLQYYLELLERHEDFAKMIFLVSAELDAPEVREVYLPHQERALELLEGAIAKWQTEGWIRDDIRPRAVAWVLLGTYQLLALMKNSGKLGEVDADAALDLARPYLQGVMTAPGATAGDDA